MKNLAKSAYNKERISGHKTLLFTVSFAKIIKKTISTFRPIVHLK